MVWLVARDLCSAVELFNDEGARPFVEEGELRKRPDEIRARKQRVRGPIHARDREGQSPAAGAGKGLQFLGKLDG